MVGVLLGAAVGGAQFFVLSLFTRAVTGGGAFGRAALLGAAQFLIAPAALVAVAFLWRGHLPAVGAGTAAALIGCSLARWLTSTRRGHAEKHAGTRFANPRARGGGGRPDA